MNKIHLAACTRGMKYSLAWHNMLVNGVRTSARATHVWGVVVKLAPTRIEVAITVVVSVCTGY